MYWSDNGIIERAQMDGENRSTVALLIYDYNNTYDARGLALDIQMNRIYFVSYASFSLHYFDLDSAGDGSVQTLFRHWYYVFSPRGIALDDQFVYWNEFWSEKVYRINKTAFDGRLEVIASGIYSPRGMVVNKGTPIRDSEY